MLARKRFKATPEKFLGVHKQKKSIITSLCPLCKLVESHLINNWKKSNTPGSAFLILNQFLILELG